MKLKFTCILLSFIFFITHLTAQNIGKIYGLNYLTDELRFTSMDINSGQVTILSSTSLSSDLFIHGNADIDPIGKRYFYVRGISPNTQILTVNVLTGETIQSSTITPTIVANPDLGIIEEPIFNIAYNWLDDEIYGLNLRAENNNVYLKFSKIDPMTGNITFIGNNEIISSSYHPGNSDIDPVNRKYFVVNGTKIYTIDLDDGSIIESPEINFPMTGTQHATGITYNWQNNTLYCQHFLSVDNPGLPTTYEIRMATLDPITGQMALISNQVINNDNYIMPLGGCDIDPTGNRYLYIREGKLFSASLSDGTILSETTIDNQNNALIPILNMSYDELTESPGESIIMDMGESIIKNQGETLVLDAWVGDEADYLWQDGSTDSDYSVNDPGSYEVTITKNEFTLQGYITVMETSVGTNNLTEEIGWEINPNPAKNYINYSFHSGDVPNGQLFLLDQNGRILKTKLGIQNQGKFDVSDIPVGTFFLKYVAGEKMAIRKVVIIE
ncbi:MAG: T9SS type A sorting domain-containing protein [Saprospiraceae bacterium]